MEGKQFHNRIWSVVLILALLLCTFLGALYDLQVRKGDYYRSASTHKIARQETVEAARGEIRGRYGQPLVTNTITYEVRLNLSFMGKEPERNANLSRLLELCRAHGVEWADSIPISKTEPFRYTTPAPFTYTDKDGEERRTSFAKLLEKLPLKELPEDRAPSAGELVSALRSWFELDEDLPGTEARALVGVLCELNLRSRDILYTDYIFAQDVDIDFISSVKEHHLTGVEIDTVSSRAYATRYAAHLLGRVSPIFREEWDQYKDKGYRMDDIVGRDGAELAFEEYLRGYPGVRNYETNASGKVISESWAVDPATGESLAPRPGGNVMLTMDPGLQEALERSMAKRIPEIPSKDTEGGAAVIIDVNTGGVLAMASYPTFDLSTIYTDVEAYNSALQDPLTPLMNRATQGRYSPGSTFKMVVAAAALEEGVTTPTEKVLDTGRFTLPEEEHYPYGNYHPQCWIYREYHTTHGWETVSDALKDSCNIYFFTMAHRLGIEQVDRYAAMFGLGEYTGFELPELKLYVAGPETSERLGGTWYGGNLLSAAIGQGDTLCTPLQLANYIATLVNGGSHYSAHLLQEVRSSDYSSVLYRREPEVLDTLNLKPETTAAIKLGMWQVANGDGSVARYFKDLPVEVGAKTGTAQTGSAHQEANSLFVCFAPYDDPQVAMAVVVEKGGSGGRLAPIAADALSYYFSTGEETDTVPVENTLLH